ncbi:hypothetical protein ACROYT_G041350 [Oculina patagonica]
MFTVMGASNDNCEAVIKSFDARLRNVEADVKAIANALNGGNPPGINIALITLFDRFLFIVSTFHYHSQLWSNIHKFNLAGGKTGFDFQETKLPTYWNTSFSKICLGMKIGQQMNFIFINKQANSLYSLIADGQYRPTSLGRDTWKTLIGSQASLQRNCNKEGFNVVGADKRASKARIGILGNNENDCNTCDSRIGFGTGGLHDDSNTCGNKVIKTVHPDVWFTKDSCLLSHEKLWMWRWRMDAAMKIDGTKRTFHFDSHFWSDRNVYNIAGGKTGFDLQETKLPSYSNTTFSKICLGMKISQQINFIVINKQANSLYSLIADGQYRATSLGRNTWKTLIGSQSSLQRNYSKARIGFLGNDGSGCSHCDSRIGFGTGGLYDDSNTCGNEACCSPDNGDKHIKAMGYILEQ